MGLSMLQTKAPWTWWPPAHIQPFDKQAAVLLGHISTP